MPKIRWISHPNPKLQHLNNTIDYPTREEVAPYLLSGQAELCTPAKRGTNEYLDEQREAEERRIALLPAHQRQTFSPVPVWGIRFLTFSQKLVVVFQHMGTELLYSETVLMDRGRPDFAASEKQFVSTLQKANCPAAVIQKYLTTKATPDVLEADAVRIAADKRAAVVQRQREAEAPRYS